ncbi:hypothetical protein Afil01_07430 [Actinorhabdospora filicis]|uniref:Concanavalin A-like lectin/glucanase superfamily protein n=1 Tax=Actinorhabdospora filicis TaxID=1785913 RepID=A0A9W6W7Y2_9ACTN|nr:hypothetical protein Afil01_07430 [Actinorhabdospora filicis]
MASQDGTRVSAFRIEYVAKLGTWCVAVRLADEAGADSLHTCAATPATTEWTHRAGGHDGSRLVIYVDGVLAASREIPAPTWNATGPFALGHALCHAEACRNLTGSLAGAKVWDRAVDRRELRDGLFGGQPIIRYTPGGG